MVLVPAGPFVMGSGEGEDERPPHVRHLPAYHIDRREVTNGEYARFVAAGASPPLQWGGAVPAPGTEDLPVTNVTWFEAMAYAIWAGKRLPTEAEWEKAARGPDGREYPWGDADDPDQRNIEGERLAAVGQRPGGASPYGCLDMAGNAWEWTADWYEAYPGSAMRCIHFGQKYKVIRGGGAIGFYGAPNSGRCAQRNRCLPYGRYDGLGFRCVADADPSRAPYEPQQLLEEAKQFLRRPFFRRPFLPRRSPKATGGSYEMEFAEILRSGRLRLDIAGPPRAEGWVRTGISFPRGILKEAGELRVLSLDGGPRPLQSKVLSRRPEGSARWVLLDFAGRSGEACLVEFAGRGAPPAPKTPLRIRREDERVTVDAGGIRYLVSRQALLEGVRRGDESSLLEGMELRLRLALKDKSVEFRPLPAERMEVEDGGPLHGAVRLVGVFAGPDRAPSPLRYDVRLHALAGIPRVHIVLTVTHLADRKAAPAQVADSSVSFSLPDPTERLLLGADRGKVEISPGRRVELLQPDDLHYEVTRDGERAAGGTRAPGWIAAGSDKGWCSLGLRHFWQNHPKALVAIPGALGLRLWAGKGPLEWEGGMAKTHEIVLEFAGAEPENLRLEPLRAAMPPAWACGTEAAGRLLPRCGESLAAIPYWESMLELDMLEWCRRMPTGMRDFGDAYYGGPYKGKNAYANLEYDVPLNFLLQFLRTGRIWCLEAAEVQARHQADIDIDHFTGRQWKHSPLHTTTEADLGHVFLRGLVLHYSLTGERRSLEAAREIGDWLAPKVARLEGIGNERQIGWSIYALTGLHEVSGDDRYLKAAREAASRLVDRQSATGRFAIRWDNRISFFNGIAMGGFIEVHRHTQDERIADATLRLLDRTLGFYPEYACRTLNGLAWALERTKDPRYLDLLERTWETSLGYLRHREVVTAGTYCSAFFPFLAQHRYPCLSLFEAPRGPLPDPASWRSIRFENGEVELFLMGRDHRSGAILVILEGLSEGRLELFDAKGERVTEVDLRDATRLFKAASISLPADGEPRRLRLAGGDPATWQVHHDRHTKVTVCDPDHRHIPGLLPRAYGFVKEGAGEVTFRLEAMGEGFHGATFHDPEGHPVAAVRRFIDLDDPGRYEIKLKAAVGGAPKGWSLEVYDAKVIGATGVSPYWASRPDDLFNPELVNRP